MNEATSSEREELLKRANNIQGVPGHGRSYEDMTDEELEKFVTTMETTFQMAFEEDDEEEDDI